MNIESTPLGVECDVRHLPGRHQAKCTSKQDAGWVFQVETSCGNRDPGTIASTHANQRGAKKMGDGNWRDGWIIDDQASKEQFDKLSALFTGKLGGPMADLVPAFGAILGIEQQPIEYGDDGLRHHANIGEGIAVEIQDFVVEGMPEPVRVSGLPHPVSSTLTMARPTSSRIRAFGLEFHNEGKSAFSAPFRWSG